MNVKGEAHAKKEALVKYMDYSMHEAAQYGLLYIPNEHRYGAAIWSKPLAMNTELERQQQKKDFFKINLGQEVLNTYVKITGIMASKAESLIPINTWYLSIVGITPQKLINDTLAKTDEMNISTYLETFTPHNISFYKRLGYTKTASFLEPINKCHLLDFETKSLTFHGFFLFTKRSARFYFINVF